MLPNATDLGTCQSRSAKQNARWNDTKARRDREFTGLVALNLIIIFVGGSFVAFGLPEQKRLDRVNQEQLHASR